MAGDYILAVGSRLLAKTENPDVIQILSQVQFFDSSKNCKQKFKLLKAFNQVV